MGKWLKEFLFGKKTLDEYDDDGNLLPKNDDGTPLSPYERAMKKANIHSKTLSLPLEEVLPSEPPKKPSRTLMQFRFGLPAKPQP